MGEFTFESQGTSTMLVYAISETDEIDSMSLGMLTNNSIPGLAATSFTQMDITKYIKYNVSAKVSAAQLFAGTVNKRRLTGVLMGIVDAMLSVEDYMIDPRTVVLDMDYIFTDVSTCDTVMICLPLLNATTNSDLSAFLKNIIFRTQFDQTENCDHVAKILNFLNSNPIFSLNDFKGLLEQIMREGQKQQTAKPVTQPVARPQPVVQQPRVTPAPPQQPRVAPVVSQQPVAEKQPPVVAKQPLQYPHVPVQKVAPPVEHPKAEPNEKPMSMFYLLQHYNKENAAKYKAQKQAQKAPKAEKPSKKSNPQKPNRPASSQSIPVGFAIPGQQTGNGFTAPVQQPTPPVQKPAQPAVPVVQRSVQPTPYQAPPVNPATPISFGETTVLGGGQIGETTVLGTASNTTRTEPHLIRMKNNEKIPLNKPVFRIGKERSYVDYFIGDNTAISRSHANIVDHNGEFFVVDTNSTNHTYVNGGMIQSNVETRLSHGTIICFANEDFEFRMY